jgi:hypothetical protein
MENERNEQNGRVKGAIYIKLMVSFDESIGDAEEKEIQVSDMFATGLISFDGVQVERFTVIDDDGEEYETEDMGFEIEITPEEIQEVIGKVLTE